MSKRHQLIEYIKYRRKAKSRHGVHSPFVYELTENLLKKKTVDSNLVLATNRHKKLVNKIIKYFNCRHILWLTNRDGESETYIAIEQDGSGKMRLRTERFNFSQFTSYETPDLYLIDLHNPNDWKTAWEKYRPYLRSDSIVLITSIHHSKEHTVAWEHIFTDRNVKLSIDLFKIGLLFFKDEFKETQHFVLKSAS